MPKLFNDDRKLAQILRNFISNALKFITQGEVRVSVRRSGEGMASFSVSDTGIGIDPKFHYAIFQDFSQVDSPIQKRLAAMETVRPDVLVSDIGMPGKDGFALIDAVRQGERARRTGRTPAIALTAFAREQDREQALKAGFDAYFTKPLKPNELLTAILRLVEDARAKRPEHSPGH